MFRVAIILVLLLDTASQTLTQTSSLPTFEAKPWIEADQLFHADPLWLGGDAAYSVDLGRSRVLWLFGDSFIADRPRSERTGSHMVHNSIAIETGYDPAHASLKFYWRTRRMKPADFAKERGENWLWPGSGARLGKKLLLFFTRVRGDSRPGSLGFQNYDWVAFLIDNPDADPRTWLLHRLHAPRNPWPVILGSAMFCTRDFVYVFGFTEPKHDAYLTRWRFDAAARGDLSSPEWWDGTQSAWINQANVRRAPAPVIVDASTEFSVHLCSGVSNFLEVQSAGFGASDIVIRHAGRVQGPWSQPIKAYHPSESDRSDAFVYAAKAHPELAGADLVITYVANSSRDQVLATDMRIYYPRFVRLSFLQQAGREDVSDREN